jgi:hypothetical protein
MQLKKERKREKKKGASFIINGLLIWPNKINDVTWAFSLFWWVIGAFHAFLVVEKKNKRLFMLAW